MKIAAKIRLSHFVLALAVLFVGLVGYIAVDQVSRQYEYALRQTMPIIDALQDARFHAVHIEAIAFESQVGPQHAVVEPKAHHVAAEDSLVTVYAALDAQLHRHRLLAEAYFPAELAVADALGAEAAQLRGALDRLAEAPVGSLAADMAMVEVEGVVGRLSRSIRDALSNEQRELVEYQEAITALRRVTLWTVAAVTLVAFGLALLVAVFFARRLRRTFGETA